MEFIVQRLYTPTKTIQTKLEFQPLDSQPHTHPRMLLSPQPARRPVTKSQPRQR
jgi:hypothetical protein